MNRNTVLGLTAAAALFAAGPSLAAAQGVTVTPLIGAYVPAGSFHELQDQAGKLERGSTLGLGFNIELGMPSRDAATSAMAAYWSVLLTCSCGRCRVSS